MMFVFNLQEVFRKIWIQQRRNTLFLRNQKAYIRHMVQLRLLFRKLEEILIFQEKWRKQYKKNKNQRIIKIKFKPLFKKKKLKQKNKKKFQLTQGLWLLDFYKKINRKLQKIIFRKSQNIQSNKMEEIKFFTIFNLLKVYRGNMYQEVLIWILMFKLLNNNNQQMILFHYQLNLLKLIFRSFKKLNNALNVKKNFLLKKLNAQLMEVNIFVIYIILIHVFIVIKLQKKMEFKLWGMQIFLIVRCLIIKVFICMLDAIWYFKINAQIRKAWNYKINKLKVLIRVFWIKLIRI
ncbi:hypothetical protein IMG5_155680 [Ichthyophthirius multifiliis]|uniref:Transmembrane protein n=1 Tax=Ichthyophthirius multifiliis TaxID=5932 RepID=G0QZB6_ICHMU|nr:hypothetical protein IMG5_155680 [Ichthyophthirius multifiliis]EGR29419.1 hypothetical protein IMG5_155680 [Ichthyophthirius multifiliis]|eukprot:XP_004030655.1 hypothetical protein IMG5_155680 [Ichthyophthirius multifiliis]